MSNRRSLISLTFIYTIGNLSSRVIGFVLIFFTTYYLSNEEIGQFDLVLITINLLIPFVSLQLSDSVLRWLIGEKDDEEEKRETISSIFFFILGMFMLFSIGYGIYNIYYPSNYYIYLNLILVLQITYILFQQTIRGLGLNKLYASNSIVNSFIYCALTILLLTVFQFGVEGLFLANIAALLITNIQLFIRGKFTQYLSLHSFSVLRLKKLLNYSFPLIPNSLSWWAISSANRYLVLFYIGASANGIFAISNKIPTILTMLISIFSLAWQEKSIEIHNSVERDSYYSDVLRKYLRILFSIAFLIVSTNQLFIRFAVSESFFESYLYTPILILSTLFFSISTFYGTVYLSTKQTRGLLISSIVGAIATLATSVLLIPKFQLYGATIAILIGYVVLLCFRIRQTKNVINIQFPIKDFLKYMLIYLSLTIIGYIESYLAIAINILLAFVVVYFLNFNLIKDYYHKHRKKRKL